MMTRRSHAAGGAHGDETALQVAPFELVEHGADQDRAGGADGMAECDRAAIDVDLGAVELEVADVLFRHHRKGLVDLEQVDVVDGEPRLRQHLARGRHRRVQHQGRRVPHVGHRDDASARLQAVRAGISGRCEQDRGGTVDDAGGIAGVMHEVDVQVRIFLQDRGRDRSCPCRRAHSRRSRGMRASMRSALPSWSAAADTLHGRARGCRPRDARARGSS